MSNVVDLASKDEFAAPQENKEEGSSFGFFDRMFQGYQNGAVFDYSEWAARDIYEMMERDYKARQIEAVLSLPVTSTTHSIVAGKGDTGEAKFLEDFWSTDSFAGGCEQSLDQILALMTSAFVYKRAYFEKVWAPGTGAFEGKLVYKKVAFRPQTTCRMLRKPRTGSFMGFEQEPYYLDPTAEARTDYIRIPPERAFVYIHGQRRDPMNGTSDLEIAYWCYKTKQKIMFLWFQFLEGVSLPRTVVKATDSTVAMQAANQIAQLKSSGIIPITTPGGTDSITVDILDASGKGADQFQAAITFLDTAAVQSVLAGFLDLSGAAANGLRGGGGGSYALSKDASDFFLQSEEAKLNEMADSVKRDLFAPLIMNNFGPNAVVPSIKFEPLNDEDKSNSVALLTTLLGSQTGGALVPDSFVGELAAQVAEYIGLDGDKVKADFAAKSEENKKLAAQNPNPLGASIPGQGVAALAGAVGQATKVVQAAKAPAPKPKPQPPKPKEAAK